MPLRKLLSALSFVGALSGAALTASADIMEGFESPDGYNLATQGGGSAAIVNNPVHSGSQALQLSLTEASDYGGSSSISARPMSRLGRSPRPIIGSIRLNRQTATTPVSDPLHKYAEQQR